MLRSTYQNKEANQYISWNGNSPVHKNGVSEFLLMGPKYFSGQLKVYIQRWDKLIIMILVHIRAY